MNLTNTFWVGVMCFPAPFSDDVKPETWGGYTCDFLFYVFT